MKPQATPVVRWLLAAMMATCWTTPAKGGPAHDDSDREVQPIGVGETAAGPEAYVGFTTAFSSRYVFRGQAYSSGPVSQSTVWIELGRFSFYAWNNVLLTTEPLQRRWNEVDLGVAYTHEMGVLTLTPAIDHYTYRTIGPLRDPPTLEASLDATWDLGSVAVFSQPVVDLMSARGAFFLRNGVAHERPLGKSVTFSAEVSLGWASGAYNDFYVGVGEAAFHHAGLDFAFEHRISDSLSVAYQLGWTRVLDTGLRRAMETPDVPRFGVTLGVDVN